MLLIAESQSKPNWKSIVNKKIKPGAKPGNQYAVKSDDEKASSYIHARCSPADKAKWVAAAQREGIKLTEWIVNQLNVAAKQF